MNDLSSSRNGNGPGLPVCFPGGLKRTVRERLERGAVFKAISKATATQKGVCQDA